MFELLTEKIYAGVQLSIKEIHAGIVADWNSGEFDVTAIANKYDYSERHVWAVICKELNQTIN